MDFDPLIPDEQLDPHALYREMRAACPVARSERFGGFWALTRHADVVEVLTSPDTYITSVQNVVPAVAFTGRRPPLHLDPPEHATYRRPLNRVFGDARVAALEPAVRAIAGDLLEPFVRDGGSNFSDAFAIPFPVHAFAHILNVPPAMMAQINEVAVVYNRALQRADDDEVKRTSLRLYEIARELVAVREASPGDPETDPTSALLAARVDGEPLPRDMVVGTVRQVLVVGIIAPSVVLGSIAAHLAHDPDLQDRLREDPYRCPGAAYARLQLRVALEEVLRRTSAMSVCGPVEMTPGVRSLPLRVVAAG